MERGVKRQERLKKRRLKAVALFEQGEQQVLVAQILHVSKQAVSQWWIAWRRGDTRKLNGAEIPGRKPRINAEQLELVERELLRGAAAHGFETDLWSLPRVAALIEKLTGVGYHPDHVWKLLHKMGWSLQRPTLRARERDEEKILEWKKTTWEQVKKTPKSTTAG